MGKSLIAMQINAFTPINEPNNTEYYFGDSDTDQDARNLRICKGKRARQHPSFFRMVTDNFWNQSMIDPNERKQDGEPIRREKPEVLGTGDSPFQAISSIHQNLMLYPIQ